MAPSCAQPRRLARGARDRDPCADAGVAGWCRDEGDVFHRVYAGDGPAWSPFFGAWLVVPAGGLLLRLSDDPEGTRLWPTEGELALRERAEKERERAEKERALARVAEMEALLAALRGGG